MTTIQHFESVPVVFKNFRGIATTYVKAGERSFSIKVDKDTARSLSKAGWGVRQHLKDHILRIKVDNDYDVDLTHLDETRFRTAEVFLEGRPWTRWVRGQQIDGLTAFLISITPQ